MVVPVHDAGDAEAAVVEALGYAGGGKLGGRVDGDAVVVSVEGFDEVVVELLVEHVDVGACDVEAGLLCDDLFAEVHVNQAGGGEFGRVGREDGVEFALVVVEAEGLWVVFPADVDDGVAGCEDGGVARADEG